jgi:hypothetical protein
MKTMFFGVAQHLQIASLKGELISPWQSIL